MSSPEIKFERARRIDGQMVDMLGMVFEAKFKDLVAFGREVVHKQTENQFDAMVGDDVSGRPPTLLAHQVLRLAQAGGHMPTIPRTYFMPSGGHQDATTRSELVNDQWLENLTERAGKIVGSIAVPRVLLVTEEIVRGDSMARLKHAFAAHDAVSQNVVSGTRYFVPASTDFWSRRGLGVSKVAPGAVSHLQPNFDARLVGHFRNFIHEAGDAVYTHIYKEPVPDMQGYRPTYTHDI